MLPGDRRLGGLWCSEVLEQLSDYLEGALPPDTVALVQAHVSECDRCARFGAEFAAVVAALREHQQAAPLTPDVATRLRRRLSAPA
ncbi:anti-sigma factor family protein [Luteitalea sp.]